MSDDWLYKPFKNINESSIAIYLSQTLIGLDINLRCKIINKYFHTEYSQIDLKNFLSRAETFTSKYPIGFIQSIGSIDKFIRSVCEDVGWIIVEPLMKCCVSCSSIFIDCQKKYYSAQLYYYAQISTKCSVVSFECSFCKTIHYPSYYITNANERFFYENACIERLISFTNETVFETLIFRSLTYDIVFKHASFSNFSNAYNALHDHLKEDNCDRCTLIEKRLTESWFYFNLLIFIKEYFGSLANFKAPYVKDIDFEIDKFQGLFIKNFHSKWLNHTNCGHQNCSVALNIDGNHKVTRLTCLHIDKKIFDQLACKHHTLFKNLIDKAYLKFDTLNFF